MPPPNKVWRIETAALGSPELQALLDDGWEPFAVGPFLTLDVWMILLRKLG